MKGKTIAIFAASLLSAAIFAPSGHAQGGWRQWDIHMRDGSTLEANPLGMRNGRLTRSMSEKEIGIERDKILYIAAGRRELPSLPKEKLKKDLIVMLDGTRTSGAVTFEEIKFSEGTLRQNGKQMTLENVAYILFAERKKKFGY